MIIKSLIWIKSARSEWQTRLIFHRSKRQIYWTIKLLLAALLLVFWTGTHDFSQESQLLFVTKSLQIHIAMSRYSLKIVPNQQPQKTREWAWARLKLSFSRNVFFSLMTGAVIYKRVKLLISLKFWCFRYVVTNKKWSHMKIWMYYHLLEFVNHDRSWNMIKVPAHQLHTNVVLNSKNKKNTVLQWLTMLFLNLVHKVIFW